MRFPALLAITALLALAYTAEAGVVSSPHDIAAQKYTVRGVEEKKQNVCSYCHVPHKAKGARLWPTVPPSLKGWGDVGPLCYSCHDGVAIVSPNVDASNTAFNPKSHGLKIENLPDGDDVSGSGLPYTSGQGSRNIECSTCHNPHDNTNRPFIRTPITELCNKCHKRRENSGYNTENAEGTHPVHKLPVDEVEGASPIEVQEDFKVQFPSDYPSENGKYTEGVHWNLGGHLSRGKDGTMECMTCHSVHGKEGVGPKGDNLLSMDPVKKDADLFCEGCHRGERGDGLGQPPHPNPGGTKEPRTYHPADNDRANGEGRIVEITQPTGWKFGEGGEVLCTTCHKPHNALKNTPILRQPVDTDTFCESCHNKAFNHHPSGGSGGLSDPNSGKPHARTRQVTISGDFQGGMTYGSPASGELYCSSCHRAHNATCQPILTARCDQAGACGICVQCHPKFNPTWQTDDNFKSTHFMGDPTLSVMDKVTVNGSVFGTQAGYNDQYPPENKDVWPESHEKSIYGGNGKEITCCSCHSFGVGGVTAGDADQSPYLGPILAPGFQPGDLTTGLLARAGSFKEWLDSDVTRVDIGGGRGGIEKVDKYLCTGCHGLTPNTHPEAKGEGLTHPMMNANGSPFTPRDPAKLTFNKHVNCESCHSPHEADSRGGFFILRLVEPRFGMVSSISGIPEPYAVKKRTDVEYASLCQKCHINY